MEKLNKYNSIMVTCIWLLLMVVSCNTCRIKKEQINLNKEIDSLYNIVQKQPIINESKMKELLDENSFEFLIYESDLDNKKTSLSDIKNKLDKN